MDAGTFEKSGASTTVRLGIGRGLAWGAGAGAGASLVMAMFAMLAAGTFKNTGFLTPLYHIAAVLIGPDTMMVSMRAAHAGHIFTFAPGPAMLGAVIHMMVGAMYGAIFGLIVSLTRLRGAALWTASLAWGLVVFAVSAWIGLPIAAALFGGGNPISHFAAMVGYPAFVIQHLLYGATLGLVVRAAPRAAR